jgi:hypothetical protein
MTNRAPVHHLRRSASLTVAAVAALLTALAAILASAIPAGAVPPQPVDASDQGALAFVGFAIMCGLIAASLFYMDRVRRRRTPGEE